MLNAQFTKTFCLCNSFLLITTSFSAAPVKSVSVSSIEEKTVAGKALSGLSKPQISLNKRGVLFVKKYIKNSNECLVRVRSRSRAPFNIMDSVFRRYGLPVELKYLAVIESELNPTALSHVGARGPWQFMPETAQVLGLKVSSHYDERTNYYKSTIAAAKYLRDLYAQFNDWLLVLAAYNGGPRPVYNAIRESGSKNFWVLQNHLPAESRDHVKKFIATHYYFEGRGSETTLTRSENAAFKKLVNEFLNVSAACKMIKTESVQLKYISENRQTIRFDMNQLLGFNYYNTIADNQIRVSLAETSEQKFRRLMKESEASLKESRKII